MSAKGSRGARAGSGDVRGMTAKRQRTTAAALSSLEDQALQQIVAHLKENRNEIMLCWVALSAGQFRQQLALQNAPSPEEDLWFPATYTTFKLLPKYWIADYFTKLGGGLTAEVVDKIDAQPQNIGGLRSLLTYFTGVAPGTYWPPAARNKEVLTNMLDALGRALGNRHVDFVARFVGDEGVVDFAAASPYTLTWREELEGERVVVAIRHTSGSQVNDMMLKISDDYTLQNGHDDLRAQFVGPTAFKPFLADLFPDGAIPLKKIMTKPNLFRLAEKATEHVKAREDAVVTGDTSILVSAEKEAKERAKATAKARARPQTDLQVPLKVRAIAPLEG